MRVDDADRLEATLRGAPWDLPVRDELIAAVLATPVRRRRDLSRLSVAAAAAAVVVVTSGVITMGSQLRGSTPADSPSSGTALPSPSRSARPATVSLGDFTFAVPLGFAPAGRSTATEARFGPRGLQNDDEPLGPRDMRVTLESWLLQPADFGTKLSVTRILARPTVEHPGPRPGTDPGDAAAAARTIVDIESTLGAGAGRAVTGLPVGPSTLVRFDDRNAVLLARPAGTAGEVLLFEVGGRGGSVDLLLQLARSAQR